MDETGGMIISTFIWQKISSKRYIKDMVQSKSKFRGRGKIREEFAILEVHTYLLESLPSTHYVHLLEENCFRSLNQQHSIQLFRGGLYHKLVSKECVNYPFKKVENGIKIAMSN